MGCNPDCGGEPVTGSHVDTGYYNIANTHLRGREFMLWLRERWPEGDDMRNHLGGEQERNYMAGYPIKEGKAERLVVNIGLQLYDTPEHLWVDTDTARKMAAQARANMKAAGMYRRRARTK